MNVQIKNVKDGKNGSRYYPRTHATAVVTNKGNTVQSELDNHNISLTDIKKTVAELELTDEKVQEAQNAAIASMQSAYNAEQSANNAESHSNHVDSALQELINSEVSVDAAVTIQVAKNSANIADIKTTAINKEVVFELDSIL